MPVSSLSRSSSNPFLSPTLALNSAIMPIPKYNLKIRSAFNILKSQFVESIITEIGMAKSASIFLFILFLYLFSGGYLVSCIQQKTWCVAKPSSDQAKLLANLNYPCSQVDCRILQKGCPCSSPDNLMNRASVAMNLYYQARGRNHWNCDFRSSGLIVITDPSYANCIYGLYICLVLGVKFDHKL